ncbi:SRPBCC family protein [Actinomadura logoneensis]|uniref:SRPBCC family protein n=1 Tax=Actinomadura logoneensis TaxID=2293572 RepID=A0A372JE42_9ACTN|nr:SRPBCC family protein [Actinomadura logoneensis]RFU38267.1 SRPBCC family protein [Actinomadura logoneensis]
MASVRQEIVIDAPPEHVWDVLRDVGAVHERLLPGRVAGTRLEGDQRFLTFPDGHVVRELIIAVDDERRRLAYAVVEGARPPVERHHASFEVRPEGDRAARLIWTTDVLPHAVAPEIRVRTERGAIEMKRAIEAAAGKAGETDGQGDLAGWRWQAARFRPPPS